MLCYIMCPLLSGCIFVSKIECVECVRCQVSGDVKAILRSFGVNDSTSHLRVYDVHAVQN